MALAFVGSLIIGAVTMTSLRSIRRQMSYETWYFIHLLAYAGFAMSFSHEIVLGQLFANDTLARWLWIALHVGVGVALIRGRWGRLFVAAMNPLHIAETKRLNNNTTELRLAGGAPQQDGRRRRSVRDRPAAGQGIVVAGPPVLALRSANDPGPEDLREVAWRRQRIDRQSPERTRESSSKGRSASTHHRRSRTGRCSSSSAASGSPPVKAMLERLDRRHQPIVLYRAHKHDDLVYASELRSMAKDLGGELMTLVGPTATLAVRDPFSGKVLRKAIPDLTERVTVLCGPERLLWAGRAGLRDAGVAAEDIHFEQPWW